MNAEAPSSPALLEPPERPRSFWFLAGLSALALLLLAGFIALGNWQMARRTWKLDLISRVEGRVNAPPAVPPGPAEWPGLTAAGAEYRALQVTGRFLPGQDTLVDANTQRGPGHWVMSPLLSEQGFILMVNRGFAGGERGSETGPPGPVPEGVVRFTGLLRWDEPGGALWRPNEPGAGRWYSRDVAALARARKLGPQPVAPYFVDARPAPGLPSPPVAGMTPLDFPNNHLVYAITWYGLALMVVGGMGVVGRHEWKLRQEQGRQDIPRPE
ncbi:SURF1 family protein [Teichococcus oryzae]|uniref:SURF1-like protein n=1 Tax=Teichococcus oryzae TaxID=1608942 RepID=A0A5B2TJI8_9PROT|nr:SURF1 family cytochrome oxidase biogenesis protein [Pseudoroseomonas oryzae]KAA2214677.1 SURF1 family protein [Pseudoroseomonas oryzae]